MFVTKMILRWTKVSIFAILVVIVSSKNDNDNTTQLIHKHPSSILQSLIKKHDAGGELSVTNRNVSKTIDDSPKISDSLINDSHRTSVATQGSHIGNNEILTVEAVEDEMIHQQSQPSLSSEPEVLVVEAVVIADEETKPLVKKSSHTYQFPLDKRPVKHPLWVKFDDTADNLKKDVAQDGNSLVDKSIADVSSSDGEKVRIEAGTITQRLQPLRVPLSSRARRRDPNKPRRKSSHTHNNAFPAQVFENVCLEMTSNGYEANLQYPSPYWQKQRGSTTLLVLVDDLTNDANNTDDDGFQKPGEPPRGWPVVDRGLPMVFTTTTPPPPEPQEPPPPPPPKPIWVPNLKQCRNCGRWVTPPAPPQAPKKKAKPSVKVRGGNKAVNDTGAWLEISWSLLSLEEYEFNERQTSLTRHGQEMKSGQDMSSGVEHTSNNIEVEREEDVSSSSSSNPFATSSTSSLPSHNPNSDSHHHLHHSRNPSVGHMRARSSEDTPSERYLTGPQWPSYSEYPVKFVASSDEDPFGQWQWVPGTTHHFQGTYGMPGDVLHSLWPSFAIFAHPNSVFVPKLDHVLIDHGCECMTLGSESNTGCCLHHSHSKGDHCNIHHHMFRIALNDWLEKKHKPPTSTSTVDNKAESETYGDFLVLPHCDCSALNESLSAVASSSNNSRERRRSLLNSDVEDENNAHSNHILKSSRRKSENKCSPKKHSTPLLKGGHYNRTICFEKLVLTPHRVNGRGKTLRGGDPLTLFGKDHEWSRALRLHLLNDFRQSAHDVFKAKYPSNGHLNGWPAFEAASSLAKKAEELLTLADEMGGSPNKGNRKGAYDQAKEAKDIANQGKPAIRFLIIGDGASAGGLGGRKGSIQGATAVQTNIMWWCVDNLRPMGLQCLVDITEGLFLPHEEFGVSVRKLATVDVLVAAYAYPLLPVVAVFLPKNAAVIEVSPYGWSKLGSPALGHLADGLGLSHCVTGSFSGLASAKTETLQDNDAWGDNGGDTGESGGFSSRGEDNVQDVDNVDFTKWNGFGRRRLEEDKEADILSSKSHASTESSSSNGGGVQLTARELNTCLDYFNLKEAQEILLASHRGQQQPMMESTSASS